jgi:hypothetical protein
MSLVYCASQPAAGEPETSASTLPGPGRLRVATLGDRLVARDPRAKVVSISNKDRAAIFMAGRDPRHAVYWYASKTGTYVSSSAYDAPGSTGELAARVVTRFNAEKAGERAQARLGTTWSRLPEPMPAPRGGFETGLDAYQDQIVGPSFPHDLVHAKRPYPSAILWTALSDRLLNDLALDVLADDTVALGRDDVTDLLMISYSANDYVSHYYGPESLEELEVVRSLDVEIGRLLDDLTARFGKGGVLVALSADHGFLPLPEATQRHNPHAPPRIADTKILAQLNAAVNAQLARTSGSPLVYKLEGSVLWLDQVALKAPGAPSAARVMEIVRQELATTWKDAVERTIPEDLPVAIRANDPMSAMARNSWVPGRSGDLFIVPRFGVLIDPYGGAGSSHGTPLEYDTHVPLVFWGSGIEAKTVRAPSSPYDLAPTLASWLGVSLPAATGTPVDAWGR